MSKLFIHATNVHQGGGKVLLESLIRTKAVNHERVLVLDSRMPLPSEFTNIGFVKRVVPNLFQRLAAEWWLSRRVAETDVVLCFGNLPPMFKLTGYVIVFMQNRYLIENVKLSDFSWKVKLRLIAERFWFKLKLRNVDEFVVQSPCMKDLLEELVRESGFSLDSDILNRNSIGLVNVLPFIDDASDYARGVKTPKDVVDKQIDFVYVASGEPHKNHGRLVKAWIVLADQGLYPSLRLTLDRGACSELVGWIDEMIKCYGLNIENSGSLCKNDVWRLYGQCNALIYPSTFESFGLPLIEARQAGLAIIASELDFVRDVVDPEQSFDPLSSYSIAMAVKRFKGIGQHPLPLRDSNQFMTYIMGKAK